MTNLTDNGAAPVLLSAAPSDYAGDISVTEAWRVLSENPDAVLVDVRTRAEWSFVGLPDLSAINKQVIVDEWQSFPSMERNEAFVSELVARLSALPGKAPLMFLCRSGARSRAAAIAMTASGHGPCYNVAGGFEGDLDEGRHRGVSNGWKAAGLPWVQS